MRSGTWYVKRVYTSGSLKTVASELAKCNLDLVTVQEGRWVEGGSESADVFTFFCGNGNANNHLQTGFFIQKGIISAVKKVKVTNDRMLYMKPRGHWCHVIVLNVHVLRIKVMIKRMAFMRNWTMYSVSI
jgi:hypothetical protein